MQGRLTLNPLKHIDPIGFILLVFAGFGWGKPIQIDSRNFNRNIKMPVAEVMVAAAGPIMNFILAIIFSMKIDIKSNTRVFNFIFKIQEEVHRYAINYHKSLRNKK